MEVSRKGRGCHLRQSVAETIRNHRLAKTPVPNNGQRLVGSKRPVQKHRQLPFPLAASLCNWVALDTKMLLFSEVTVCQI